MSETTTPAPETAVPRLDRAPEPAPPDDIGYDFDPNMRGAQEPLTELQKSEVSMFMNNFETVRWGSKGTHFLFTYPMAQGRHEEAIREEITHRMGMRLGFDVDQELSNREDIGLYNMEKFRPYLAKILHDADSLDLSQVYAVYRGVHIKLGNRPGHGIYVTEYEMSDPRYKNPLTAPIIRLIGAEATQLPTTVSPLSQLLLPAHIQAKLSGIQ